MEDLEEKLIQDKWVTPEQLGLAAQEAKRLGKSIWVALVKLGILSQEDIAMFLAQESGICYVRISDYEISNEVIRLVDEDFCRQNRIFPLFKIKNRLFVACANPQDTAITDNLMSKTGLDIEPLIANPDLISQAQDYYYGLQERHFDLHRFILKKRPMRSIPLYRASERISLNVPVWLYLETKELVLHRPSPIEGITRDISNDGTCVGLHISLFIPKGTIIRLEFRPSAKTSLKSTIKLRGEIVYCRMDKGRHYLLGVKFVQMQDNSRKELLKLLN